jgi:hypothetical protein
MFGERPPYPRGTEGLGFVGPIWSMTVDCWQDEPARRPTMAAVVEFLREWSAISLNRVRVLTDTSVALPSPCSYTTHTVDPSLSTLTPWKSSGIAADTSIYGVISPVLTDTSPTTSTGTSYNSGHSFPPIQEHSVTQSPTSPQPPFPGVSHGSRTSLEVSLSDESYPFPHPGDSSGEHPRKLG